jgi:Flp pilus assembly protein TadG
MWATRTAVLWQTARRIAADARGATTVEFGLVSGFLFLILFAIADFGFAFWQWSSASKALQLGVRLASVSDPVASDLKTFTGLSSSGSAAEHRRAAVAAPSTRRRSTRSFTGAAT